MNRVKRHWVMISLNFAIAIAVGVVFLAHRISHNPAMAEEQVAPAAGTSMDSADHSDIRGLREKLALQNDDLAAIGLGQQEAESLLMMVKNWHGRNKTRIQQVRQAESQAQANVNMATRSIRTGPRNESLIQSMGGLKAAHSQAVSQRMNLEKELLAAVESELSEDGKAIWQAARGLRGVSEPYRYVPGLSAEHARALASMKRSTNFNGEQMDQMERSALSQAQHEKLGVIRTRLKQNIQAVRIAEEAILPMPADTRPDLRIEHESRRIQ